MPYGQRSLVVLALLGILSAIMSVMSVILIFQLQALQASLQEPYSFGASETSSVVRPVSTVLSALSLTLNLSSVVLCLLHSYFTTEIWREDEPHRADWFLLDNRALRHAAIGSFCFGISVYLGAMSIYMLLVFEIETGIASVCVLSSGVVVLLVIVTHSLIKAARIHEQYRNQHINTVFKNDPECGPGVHTPERARSSRQTSVPRQFYQSSPEPTQQNAQPNSPFGQYSEREARNEIRSVQTNKPLSAESGLLQAQAKPWNGVTNEMRTVLARKATGKDSTLV
ncbi:transmembrane protein 221 [Brachyhypopomus gauderio]|uniref:transmembrane protein 221 n=1 Tax=Brachyhypopomus gauderio TaxID=698409 RepID=UPI004042A5AE